MFCRTNGVNLHRSLAVPIAWGWGATAAPEHTAARTQRITGAMHHRQRDKAPAPTGQPSPPGEAGLGSERIGFSASPPSRTSLLRAASTHHWVRSGVQGGLRCGWPPGPPPGIPPARSRHSAPLMKYSWSLGGAGGQSCLGPCALGPLSLAASRTPHLLALPHRGSPPPRPNQPLSICSIAAEAAQSCSFLLT